MNRLRLKGYKERDLTVRSVQETHKSLEAKDDLRTPEGQ